MKKVTSVLLCLLVLSGVFSGCGNASASNSDPLQIVTTIFPIYDWVREILGDRADTAEITLLLDSGVDLHSYQPTADDMIKISTCDLFIYVGGESDEWVEDALANVAGRNTKVINLMDALGDGVKEEEFVDGMEHDHAHEESEEHGEDSPEGDQHEHEADEHIWLSLKNAQVLCQVIADALAQIDPDHSTGYGENVASYLEKLSALDGQYQAAASAGQKHTVLFGDRFPFRYLLDDYGIGYYAAFSGCSAETEASFETIRFLAGKVDELGLNCVLTIENTNHRIAQTIVENTAHQNQQVLAMNSMQAVTSREAQAGVTYLSIMEENLSVLAQALR